MDELLECEVRWCFRVACVAFHAAHLCCLAQGGLSVAAAGRRRMACRAMFYLCQAPWFSSGGNRSVGGTVLSGMVAAGGVRVGMVRSM